MYIEPQIRVNAITAEDINRIQSGLDQVSRILRDMEADAEYLKLEPNQAQAIRVAGALVMSALVDIDPVASRRTASQHYRDGIYSAIGAKY
jgi:hypothetical protein